MLKTILLNTTTRRIGGIIETIDSMYTVGQTYDGMLAVTSDGLPNVSDEELVSLWYYTTTNTWLENTPSPGIFYLWNYNLVTDTYSWVLTNPSPVLSITTTIGFKQVNLSWTITDTNYPDIFYLVDISTDNFTSTLVADKYLSYIDENTTTTARTYYLRPYWLNDIGTVVYGTIYNTGSVTPSSIQNIDVATGAISGTKLASGTVNTQLAGTGVNVLNPRYTTFEEGVLPPFTTHASGTLSQDATAKYFGTKSLKIVTTGIGGFWGSPTKVNNITPNKKWILSCYVYSDTIIAVPVWGTAGVHVGISTASAYYGTGGYDGNAAYGTLTILAGTWTRIYGVLDLTADSNTTCDIRLDSHATGKNVWFDGIMLEAQVGDLKTPSVYQEPVNFQNTYTGDLNATLGANLLSTYTLPVGTTPASLTLTTGVSAMTYTPATGTLTRTGGLSTLSSVNLNTATVARTLSTVALNIIDTTVAHGYAQQNCVLYTDNGTAISGLVSGICYYVIYLTATTFKLSATIPTATNGTGTAIALGAVTVGTTYNFSAVDYITTTAAHSYLQQHGVRYSHSSLGTTISGLVHTAVYFVVYLSATTFALATTSANAGTVSGGVVSSISLGATTVGTTYNFALYSWSGSGYSTAGFTGGAQVSFTTVAPSTGSYMVGLNSDPVTDAVYSTLDYAIYIAGLNQNIYESNVHITRPGATNTYVAGDRFSVIYNGANLVNYYKNGILFYSTYVKTPITAALYMDSSFYNTGMSCTNLEFNGYSAPVLLSGNNVVGVIHAGNAGDHLSDNIISTATVLPNSISDFQSSSMDSDASNYEYAQLGGYISTSIILGALTAQGDPYSKVLALMSLSNISLGAPTSDAQISISVQKQSLNQLYYTQGIGTGSGADIGQAYEPPLTTEVAWYVTAPYTITFNAATGVNITTDTFTTAASNYYTGSKVRYMDTNGGLPSLVDLSSYTEYYIIKLTSTTFQLAYTLEDALEKVPIPINITAVGTGIHQFESAYDTYARYYSQPTKSVTVTPSAAGVNITTDVFTIYAMYPNGVLGGDRIFTGMDLIYTNNSAGVDIAPLVSGTMYYVIKLTNTTFKLATTKANATAATPVAINITTVGSGAVGSHEFIGLNKWMYFGSGSGFNIGQHLITPSTNYLSTTVTDSSSMGVNSIDTFIYTLDLLFDGRSPPQMGFAAVLSALVSKR